MQKHVYILINDVVSGVMNFTWNITGVDSYMNNISLVIKFLLKIGMGMNNPVTDLTIK